MKKTNFLRNFGLLAAAALVSFAACTKDPGTDAEDPGTEDAVKEIPSAEEIIGVWGALGHKFELNYGKSALYQMNEAGDDFAYDDEGNYITTTIEKYVEKWCADYNADPENTEYTAVPEDVVYSEYEEQDGMIDFGTFQLTDKFIQFNQGMKGIFTFDLLSIKGEDYTYDEETGIIKVTNYAIEDDPVDIQIRVRTNDRGGLTFTYSDYYIYTLWTYDQTVEYWPYTPISYICQEGEVPAPSVQGTSVKSSVPSFEKSLRK